MPVKITWADAEQSAINFYLDREWIWEEFHASTIKIRDMMNNAGHPVNLVVVFEAYDMIPLRALANFGRSLRETMSPNLNLVVIVGANGMLHSLGNVLRRLYPRQMSRVLEAHTMQHAQRLIETHGVKSEVS